MKRVLLDTHALLWWFEDPTLLSKEARSVIRNGENTIYVSAAAVWEITIKKSLGKLQSPDNLEKLMTEVNFSPLSITISHALAVSSLPPYHQDPFDRIQIAQAKMERLTFITRDRNIQQYDVPIIVA